MKYKLLLRVLSLLLLFCFAQCKKQHDTPKTEIEKLPAITHEGKNTFGCLLNGIAYTPGGGGILDIVLSVQYDPTFQGGQFIIKTKDLRNINNNISLYLHADSINTPGTYPLLFKSKYWINYDAVQNNNCSYTNYYTSPVSGFLSLSKFNVINRIVSGTFAFKFSTVQCGIIDATEGRFDVKY